MSLSLRKSCRKRKESRISSSERSLRIDLSSRILRSDGYQADNLIDEYYDQA